MRDNKDVLMRRCSFCKKTGIDTTINYLMYKGDVAICDDCITTFMGLMAASSNKRIATLEGIIRQFEIGEE